MESAHAPVARITPARAGKRHVVSSLYCLPWDHPRACGEKVSVDIGDGTEPGSPPRVRGKVRVLDIAERGVGITPARAGKRSARISRRCATWDHPRACGEKGQTQHGL